MKPRLRALAESNASLWVLAASPVLWAAHFLAAYAFAATWCGRLGDGSLATVRLVVAILTAVALAGIGTVGFVAAGWRAGESAPHDADTPEDRRRFMGMATLLLSGLSAIGVIYSALAAVFIGTCE